MNQSPNIIVKAGAGTGKTFCVTEGVHGMMYSPLFKKHLGSEEQLAVWEAMMADRYPGKIHMTSFTNDASDQLADRCPMDMYGKPLVSSSSTFSMGCSFAKKAGQAGNIDKYKNKYKKLTTEFLGKTKFESRDCLPGVWDAIFELQEKARLDLRVEMTEEQVQDLAEHYSIDFSYGNLEQITSGVNAVLKGGREMTWQYDFVDMVYLPVVQGLVRKTYGTLVVDEFQDMGRAQQELCLMAGWKLIIIGDTHQAIYGWAGADASAFKRIESFLSVTKKGVATYPLNLTRRCPNKVVEVANRLLPEESKLKALPNAPDGKVVRCGQGEFYADFMSGILSPYTAVNHVQQSDLMIICPTNAPLIGMLFKLAKKGVKAYVKGQDITESMQKFVANYSAGVEDLRSGIAEKLDKLYSRKRNRTSETQIDIYQSLQDMAAECHTISAVQSSIANMFSDTHRPGWIPLSSIHRSKGLEAKTVVVWQIDRCKRKGSTKPWQKVEDVNLEYVACTRAKEELYMVRSLG